MSEKEQKMGGASEEKRCTERVIDVPIAVTAIELRRFAEILQALADASEVGSPFKRYKMDPVPQKRVVNLRICDLKIVNTWSEETDPNTLQPVKVISGCEITPSVVNRGWSYCLCNDTESRMHVKFDCSEIDPDEFYIDPGATVMIVVSDEFITPDKKDTNRKLYLYTIWRVDGSGAETVCSDSGGPKMGIQDPPGGG